MKNYLGSEKMVQIEKKFEHGNKVKDRVTGFEGIITGHSDYMNGCDHYLVQPPVTKEGAFQEAKWFDEADLQLVEEPKVVKTETTRTGGPLLNAPPRR